MRTSPAFAFLLVTAVGVFIYFFLKGIVLTLWSWVKSKSLPKNFVFSNQAWLAFWSLGIALAFYVALTIALKKSDRYEVVVYPFLILVIAYFLNKLKCYLSLPLLIVYAAYALIGLRQYDPYFLSYSNPLLGGMVTRLYELDNTPFGVGTYAAFNVVKKDMVQNSQTGFYTISGSKSIKAISVGGRFSLYSSCVTDYSIVYAFDTPPTYVCVQKYSMIGTVKIDGFDYWYIYKRLAQKHQNTYPSD